MASPDKIIAQGTDIHKFLPQRPPMVMIDTFISCTDIKTFTSLTIIPENIFVTNGFLAEPGIIENIAQTAAAGLGFSIINKGLGNEVPVGVIGGINNLKIYFLPKTGVVIKTEVTIVHEVLNASIISGKVFAGNRLVADCEMKIFLINGQNKE
jgi:predicted hotdog family 3-hydroxylacyl-ACP dehydratase